MKILKTKKWVGLDQYKPIEEKNIYSDLNAPTYNKNIHALINQSITIVKNDKMIIPLKDIEYRKIASVAIGGKGQNYFQDRLKGYADVKLFSLPKNPTVAQVDALLVSLKPYSDVIVSFHSYSNSPTRHFGITTAMQSTLKKITDYKSVILASFTNPYVFNILNETQKCNAVIVGYNNAKLTQESMAQIIFGGLGAKGKLPVSAGSFEAGIGYSTQAIRFSYVDPSEVGFDRMKLKNIDWLVGHAIRKGAMPGCQILIARHNSIVWNKTYGYHTYDDVLGVKPNDIYDLASLTKVVSTLPALMQLVDIHKVNLDSTLGTYLPDWLKALLTQIFGLGIYSCTNRD